MQPSKSLTTPEEILDRADAPLNLKLHCKSCDKRFSRSVEWACISPEHAADDGDWDGVVLSDIVECPRCEAVDEYDIAPMSKLRLSMPAIREPETEEGGRVIIGVSHLWDGSIVRRPTRALERLRELTREKPESARAFRHLGNACGRWHCHDEALSAWRKACELDEAEVDAAFAIARFLLHPGRDPTEGFGYLRRALHAFPEAVRAERVRPELGGAIVELLEEVVQSTREPMALMATWDTAPRGGDPVLTLSAVDLRKLERFDRLADLVSAGHFLGLEMTPELPDEEPTLLQQLLSPEGSHIASPRYYDVPVSPPRNRPVRAPKSVGRNDPCPCGSGTKYKRCCGRKTAK